MPLLLQTRWWNNLPGHQVADGNGKIFAVWFRQQKFSVTVQLSDIYPDYITVKNHLTSE